MTTETLVLLLTCVLALIHIFAPSIFVLGLNGPAALLGSRDDIKVPESHIAGRTTRAVSNFKETLPIALALLVLVQALNKANGTSAMGAWIYFGCRCAYLPIYILGIPYLRTAVWAGSIFGLLLIALQVM